MDDRARYLKLLKVMEATVLLNISPKLGMMHNAATAIPRSIDNEIFSRIKDFGPSDIAKNILTEVQVVDFGLELYGQGGLMRYI